MIGPSACVHQTPDPSADQAANGPYHRPRLRDQRSPGVLLTCIALIAGATSFAQQGSERYNLGMFFPAAMERSDWNLSIGFVTFTTPEDVTEEVRVRVPAGDVHALRRLYKGFYLDGRALVQIVQNHYSIGARWATPLNDRFTFGIGDDVAFWHGHLPIQDFDCSSRGWMNYPSISIGFRSRRDLLFTLKAELLVTTKRSVNIEGRLREYNATIVNGSMYSLYMEQPFFKKTYVTLGLSLAYTSFLWSTWSLFPVFDRNLFYPQFTTALIL
jgi:hypothetical protein